MPLPLYFMSCSRFHVRLLPPYPPIRASLVSDGRSRMAPPVRARESFRDLIIYFTLSTHSFISLMTERCTLLLSFRSRWPYPFDDFQQPNVVQGCWNRCFSDTTHSIRCSPRAAFSRRPLGCARVFLSKRSGIPVVRHALYLSCSGTVPD